MDSHLFLPGLLPISIQMRSAGKPGRHMTNGHRLLMKRPGKLGIDFCGGKPIGISVFIAIGIGYFLDSRKPHRGHAHGTWMAAGKDAAPCQTGRAKVLAGRSDSLQLGMRGRIVCRYYFVDALGDDLTVAHDQRAEWAATLLRISIGKLDRLLEKICILL